ncbi:homocysteine S-methyltransferase [Synergistales bacterium]|nr:homocysteine S-methyltransferase [Synergistales bacterium]
MSQQNAKNRKELMECLKNGTDLLLLDGGMGTMLAERGWTPPLLPEEMNLSAPDVLREVHKLYIEAGANIIETNTFGGSSLKLAHRELGNDAVKICAAAAKIARSMAGEHALVAGSAGPLGELLEPFGSLSFESAMSAFRPQFQGLIEGGADFILIETALDLREVKAAVAALKELDKTFPFAVSMTFEQRGRTVTGAAPEVVAHWARTVGAVAVGANCGVGPEKYIETTALLHEHSGLPVMVFANAGLPNDPEYWGPEKYADAALRLVEAGATVVGGCCGTNPTHIAAMRDRLSGVSVAPRTKPCVLPFASRGRLVAGGLGHGLTLVGEEINASRPSMKPHIASGNWSAVADAARAQDKAGAQVIDINVGLPQTDQIKAMKEAVAAVENATDLPLSIDSDISDVVEAGLRTCTGIPLLNSVTAKAGEVERGIEMAQKYGAVLAVLPLNEQGIPESIEARTSIIKQITDIADKKGYPRSMLVIDGLCMSVGADAAAANIGLETLRQIRGSGCCSMLGLSNISHGMPARSVINRVWLAMAMAAGLNLAIANPRDSAIQETVTAANLLCGHDKDAKVYLSKVDSFTTASHSAAPVQDETVSVSSSAESESNASDEWAILQHAIVQGDADKAGSLGKKMDDKNTDPTTIINKGVVPALAEVGRLYDSGRYFLPQLLSAAGAAQRVCDAELARISDAGASIDKGTIVLATVEGDLHDLGKNVVATMLRSNGYTVVDLGKNVPYAEIEKTAREKNAKVIGLSALMTSTMIRMEEDVAAIKTALPKVKVIVGGASVSDDYSQRIGADGYSPDAVNAVKLVAGLLERNP